MKPLPAFSDPAEDRTLDPQIKSLLLYQLSYGVKWTANVKQKNLPENLFHKTIIFILNTYICALPAMVTKAGAKKELYEQPDIYYDKA
jgi:hypothetical protein